jgi:NCS2 family nucleobase:cation symporter-2
MTRPAGLLYASEETPPLAVLIISAIQHIAVIAITLIYPLIIAREAGLTGAQFLDTVSLSMLAIGLATIFLCMRSRFVGCGYLCPASFTAIFLGPSQYALQLGGLGLIFGMTIMAGFVQVAIAPVLNRLRALLPPEIAGLVIAIVGLSLASVGLRYSLGITGGSQIQPIFPVIAGLSLATMVVLNVWTSGYAKMFCALIGVIVGYAASAALGVLDLSVMMPTQGLSLLHLPDIGHIEYKFDALALAPFVVAAIGSTLRTMGDVTNVQRLNDKDWVRPDFRSISGGVTSNGLGSIVCGLMGCLGSNTYSSSIGLSSATGVTSRKVGYAIGAGFILLAFVPAAAVVFAAMPPPVMGAALFFTSAFVFVTGLQMITARMLDARKTLVIGFSFAMAVMADIYRDLFMTAPIALQPILGNPLVLGTVCAIALNLIMRIGVRKRVNITIEPEQDSRVVAEQFLTEQGTRWAARRDVVNRAAFGVAQVLEVIGPTAGRVEIEANFDEFSLNLRLRYTGAPLLIPETRPTPREIVASEDGEQRLAGYLLRRSADRIISRADGDRAEVDLHYEH